MKRRDLLTALPALLATGEAGSPVIPSEQFVRGTGPGSTLAAYQALVEELLRQLPGAQIITGPLLDGRKLEEACNG